VDAISNEVNSRSTPTMVGFAEERALGESANSQRMRNVKNTLTDMKRLLGRRYSDPQVQTLLATMPYQHEALSEDRIGLKVHHDGKQVVFTPQQVVAMLLVHLKEVAERGVNGLVGFSVLSVPIWYSDTQRRALRDAATIAGFPQMRLFSEPAAGTLACVRGGVERVSGHVCECWPVFVVSGVAAKCVSVDACLLGAGRRCARVALRLSV
jgi:molecular chaperone DnaK (HSP70)